MKTLLCVLVLSFLGTASWAHELDRHARAVESPAPSYPPPGEAPVGYEKAEGIVSVLLRVDTKGDGTVVRIMCSSSQRFSEAVRIGVKRWKFLPGRRDGRLSDDLLEFVIVFAPDKETKIIGPLYES